MLAAPHAIHSWLRQTQCDIFIYGHVHYLQHKVLHDIKSTPITVLTLDSWENKINYATLALDTCQLSH